MKFYSNGKFLITGEYLILDGAKSLAVPTKFGQELKIDSNDSKFIEWESLDKNGKVWFKCKIQISNLNLESTSSEKISNKLLKILKFIRKEKPEFLRNQGHKITTSLTFDKNWGLGTSSTLINNLSKLSEIDPFKLNKRIFKGSGYDIACASSNSHILYQIIDDNHIIKNVKFNPPFKKHLYFVYLNKKQNSLEELNIYNKVKKKKSIVSEIDEITLKVLNCRNFDEFNNLISSHEKIISSIISKKTIKSKFKDFNGELKSLGAWGGDFILASTKDDPYKYFNSKGLETIYKFDEIVL
jgi:mevalonate kinase